MNDNLEMANKINKFFADIGRNLALNIPPSLLELDYDMIEGLVTTGTYIGLTRRYNGTFVNDSR